MLDAAGLRLNANALDMILTQTFKTMIANTLKDGNSRRLGDYFTLQLEVKGRFEEAGDQFDPSRHKLALTLRPLGGILNRKPPARGGVTVYNRNAGPTVKVERIYSDGTPEKRGLVFGKDIVIEGENLFMATEPRHDNERQDTVLVKYFSQFERSVTWTNLIGDDVTVSADGRRMVVPWHRAIGEYFELNADRDDPERNHPVALMLGIRSRGGEQSAKPQLHRARAFFDSWLERHPDWGMHSLMWGGF